MEMNSFPENRRDLLGFHTTEYRQKCLLRRIGRFIPVACGLTYSLFGNLFLIMRARPDGAEQAFEHRSPS